MLDGIELQTKVYKAGIDFWNQVALWGIERKMLIPREMDVLRLISQGATPSEKQSAMVLRTLERLQKDGCPLVLDVVDELVIDLRSD